MSKIIYLGDLHLGASKDNPVIQRAQKEAVRFMIAYAEQHDIEVILQLGDFFDVRSGVSQETLNFLNNEITPLFESWGGEVDVLVGNHDMHLRNVITPNSPKEVLRSDCYVVHEHPTFVQVGSTMIDIIPWICKDNEEQINEFIKESHSEYCVGHFELDGFEMYKGTVAKGERTADFLERYKHVFSGHYHTASQRGNVTYTGTPITLTMGDANEARGFWVHDLDTGEFEFVRNPNGTMHHSLMYSEDFDVNCIDDYAGKFVRLIVPMVDKRLDAVLAKFEDVCADFKHKETFELTVDLNDDSIETLATIDVAKAYLETLVTDPIDRELTEAIFLRTYNEAMAT